MKPKAFCNHCGKWVDRAFEINARSTTGLRACMRCLAEHCQRMDAVSHTLTKIRKIVLREWPSQG